LSAATVAPEVSRFNPADMALRGRIGACVTHSRHDSREITANARTAFLGRFLAEVDPEGVLPEAERERRAGFARRAHFARLARSSALSRSKKGHPRTRNATAPNVGGVPNGFDRQDQAARQPAPLSLPA
jgi:hypothetical protein